MTKIAILCNGDVVWASSRLRGYAYADADPLNIRAYGPGDELDAWVNNCDAVVFQKRYKLPDIERGLRYKAQGKVVIFDLTDPMWWWYPKECGAMLELADVVTTSSAALAEAVEGSGKAKRVVTIPDRMLPGFHPTIVQHAAKERTVLVWYGDSGNRIALDGYLPLLGYMSHHFPLELRIIDNAPGMKVAFEGNERLLITHLPWTLETFHGQLMGCDIAYLPPYPGPWGVLKSNNRAVTAMWAGLPIVDGMDVGAMAELFENVALRQEIANQGRAIAERDYDVHISVAELKALVESTEPVPLNVNGSKERVTA